MFAITAQHPEFGEVYLARYDAAGNAFFHTAYTYAVYNYVGRSFAVKRLAQITDGMSAEGREMFKVAAISDLRLPPSKSLPRTIAPGVKEIRLVRDEGGAYVS
jgi:hypothetical protein